MTASVGPGPQTTVLGSDYDNRDTAELHGAVIAHFGPPVGATNPKPPLSEHGLLLDGVHVVAYIAGSGECRLSAGHFSPTGEPLED